MFMTCYHKLIRSVLDEKCQMWTQARLMFYGRVGRAGLLKKKPGWTSRFGYETVVMKLCTGGHRVVKFGVRIPAPSKSPLAV